MEIRETLIDLLNNKFFGNKQKFLCYIINSKTILDIKKNIINITSFLVNPSWSQRVYHILNNLEKTPFCYCDKEVKFFDLSKGYNEYCSSSCRAKSKKVREKIEKTNLERYGTKTPGENQDIKNKVKATCLERYGYESHNQNESVKKLKKESWLKNLGVENPSLSEEVKERRKKTFLRNWNVENPNMSEVIKKQKKEDCLKRHGVPWYTQIPESRNKQRETLKRGIYKKLVNNFRIQERVKFLFSEEEYINNSEKEIPFLCLKCNKIFYSILKGNVPRCLDCYPLYKGFSIIEKEIVNWIKKELLILNIVENDRKIISPLGLDIYLPDYNLAIEFNGLFWHSECGNNKDRYYHFNKTKKCLQQGIQLIHIFEDEWINKSDIVKSIIKHKIGIINNKIYARNLKFKEINLKEGYNFLEINHLDNSNSRILKFYGLIDNFLDIKFIVGIGSSRYNKNYDYEIIRSCSKIDTIIVGGFNKIIKNIPLKGSIISYVDRRYFTGSGYKNWVFERNLPPIYYYTKKYKDREQRTKFRKSKIKKLFPDVYDKDLTEWEMMQLAGYDRIWDCGKLSFSRQL